MKRARPTLSIVLAVLILAPVISPALGQGLIAIGSWRATFVGLIALVPWTLAFTVRGIAGRVELRARQYRISPEAVE